ncbi:MAG: ECF-type sigma factor [Balneolaceae bacterium]
MKKSEVTKLLVELNKGNEDAYDHLYPLIYDELKGLAYSQLSRQSGHTFSKTELVHETYLKMVNQNHHEVDFKNRSHFLAIASRCMRQVLIDYARKKKAEKRGGNQQDLTYIDELFSTQQQKADELIGIDNALDRLTSLNKRLSKVVEMRFFGEMTIEDTAEALELSESTVKRDWLIAKGWLHKELKKNQ